MTDPVAEREAIAADLLAQWDSLPAEQRCPQGFRNALAWLQANFVSAARGLEAANAETERLYALHPDDRPGE